MFVPNQELAAAEGFRRRHQLRQVAASGRAWSYLRGGRGRRAVLFLHGVLGDAYDAGPLLGPLEDELIFVAPSMPAVASLAELAAGIEAILDQEGIGQVVVVGGSFAGLLAQGFFHRRRQRVAHLLLYDCSGPDRRQGRRNRRNAWLWDFLPLSLLGSLLRLRLRYLLRSPGGLEPAQEEVLAAARQRFDERLAKIDRAIAISQMRLAIEVNLEDPALPVPLGGWPGRIVLIGPDDAPLLREGQAILDRVFPGAEKITIHGAGMLGSLLQPEVYRQAIRRLL